MADIYVIDACSLFVLEANRPRSRHGCLWGLLDSMVAEGRLKSPNSVYSEIRPSNKPLCAWAKEKYRSSRIGPGAPIGGPGLFVPDEAVWRDASDIMDKHRDLVESHTAGAAADPFVIALARRINCNLAGDEAVIVTEECDEEGRIPHVARFYGVRTIRLEEFLRKIGVQGGRVAARRGRRGRGRRTAQGG